MQNRFLAVMFFSLATAASVADSKFGTGPVFQEFGPVAAVDLTMAIPTDAAFKHSFDTATPATDGQPNGTLNSVARFINMHARAGVPIENIQAAVVVHGKAVLEMADKGSGSAPLIAKLSEHGVRIIVCGQSAAYYNVATDDLLPGVEMALSAMTAHALLQQQGYTLNPF